MRVLHLTNKPIYPTIDGGCLAMKSLTDILLSAPQLNVFHFSLSTHKHPFVKKAYNSCKYLATENIEINTKTNPFAFAKKFLLSKSYNISRFYTHQAEQALSNFIKKHKIEVVIAESIYLLPYFRLLKQHNLKLFIRTHNVEFDIWNQKASQLRKGVKKWITTKLAKQLEIEEKKAWQQADGILAITQNDADQIKYYQENTVLLNTTVQVSDTETNYKLNDFFFLGAYDWKPNQVALDWLIKDVLQPNNFSSTLHIAGKNLPKSAYSNYPFVKNHGEIASATDFISTHGISVIPLNSGGGIKMKVLESLAHGKPVISTKEGIKGLLKLTGKEIYVAKNAAHFYAAMCSFEESEEKRKTYGHAGKQYLIDNFAIASEQKKLIEFISR